MSLLATVVLIMSQQGICPFKAVRIIFGTWVLRPRYYKDDFFPQISYVLNQTHAALL